MTERILKREKSFSTRCKCNMIVYISDSFPYNKKWYHFHEYRLFKCTICHKEGFFLVNDIPKLTLKQLKYHDNHICR